MVACSKFRLQTSMVALTPTLLAPAVGGSFVTGGYDVVLFVGSGNPIEGRDAWGGISAGGTGGYIMTVVNLGPNVTGQTIKLRFRMGTDQSVGGIQDGTLTPFRSRVGLVLSARL